MRPFLAKNLSPGSLRTRIIIWSFIPTAIILFTVALVTFSAYQNTTEELVLGRNRELTRLSAGSFSTDLSSYAQTLTGLSRTSELQTQDPMLLREGLKRLANRAIVFDGGTVVLNSNGVVVAAEPERPEALGRAWSDRLYYRQLLRSVGPVFSDVTADGPQGSNVIAIAVPITGPRGEYFGALIGNFRLGEQTFSALYGSIVKLRPSGTGKLYLVDGQGRIIYHPDTSIITTTVQTEDIWLQILAGNTNPARAWTSDGREVLSSYSPVPGTSWGLITEEDWAELSSPTLGYRGFLIFLLALGLIAPTLVVMFGLRQITYPLSELMSAAREVASGNFDRKIRVKTGDELEQLAEQFNRMSERLQESYANLERRVADRTRELATINSVSNVVSASLDIDEILSDSLEKLLEIINLDAGAAYRYDFTTKSLVLMVYRGLSEESVQNGISVPPEFGAAGTVLATGKLTIFSLDDYPNQILRTVLEGERIEQIVSVPFISKGKVQGVANLGVRSKRQITTEERSLLETIGQQVGVALENARLYEQAEQSAASAERNRLARDLHDAVSQTLFSASLIAEVLPKIWERDPKGGLQLLEELRELTRGALAEMRTLLLELRPSALQEAKLTDLLRQLAEAINGRSRVPVELSVEGDTEIIDSLSVDAKIALYRIAQESLNNVAKHSGASKAWVTLETISEDDGKTGDGDDSTNLSPLPDENPYAETAIELSIRDNGHGFDPSNVPSDHLGLGIMRERAESIGARVEIVSEPGQGAVVSVTLVLSPPQSRSGIIRGGIAHSLA